MAESDNDLIAGLISDFREYAAVNLYIKTKSGDIRPLIFNDPQEYIHEQLEGQLASTGKIRAIILKGRQQGASTYTEGRIYWHTSTQEGKKAYILTHEQAATDNLFNMSKMYHDLSNPVLRPSTSASNAKEMVFDQLYGGYKVGTAGSKGTGRSGTYQYMHLSEVAFWPNAYAHFGGVVQCVPAEDNTEIIVESTANGIGGKFHELWTAAVNGESEYLAIFVPWFWTTEYRIPAKPDMVLTELEKQRVKLYGLDNDQIAWYRLKTMEMGIDICSQEYPHCWQDAFIASGRTYFDKPDMQVALSNCWSPINRMEFTDRFVDRSDGELLVWFKPIKGSRYVIGADVAEGLERGDYSCCDVLDKATGEQVAHWHGKIAPDVYGILLAELGKMYNNALIGVEANNHGLTTNIALRDSGYPNLYIEHDLDNRGGAEKETKRIGWMTTSTSKRFALDLLGAALREGTHGIYHADTLAEMQGFIKKADGSAGSQENCHDDRVMSRAIAGAMLYIDY